VFDSCEHLDQLNNHYIPIRRNPFIMAAVSKKSDIFTSIPEPPKDVLPICPNFQNCGFETIPLGRIREYRVHGFYLSEECHN